MADLMLAVGTDDFRRAERILDQLTERGQGDQLARRSPRAVGLMAWGYAHLLRIEDIHALLRGRPTKPRPVVRYGTQQFEDPPPGAASFVPTTSAGPLDVVRCCVHYLLGQLDQPAEPASSRWIDALTRPWRIAALRATGEDRRQRAAIAHPNHLPAGFEIGTKAASTRTSRRRIRA